VIDDHAHPFPGQFTPLQLADISLDVRTGEGADGRRRTLAPGRLSTELLVNRLAAYLQCDPPDVPAARDARAARDWQQHVRTLVADAGLTGFLMDAPAGFDREQCAALAGVPVWELARAEPVIDSLLAAGASAREVIAAMDEFMAESAARGVAGFKTVIAYRTGLAVDPGASLAEASRSLEPDLPVRRRGKALRDLVLRRMLGAADDLGLPVQVHTGYGDSDLRLAEADPLLLEEVLRTPEGEAATVVLIHGSFPWHDQAAYLASVKPNLYTEISLSTLFSPVMAADRLLRLLDTAPAERILAGTDGHGPPETHWFAAGTLARALDRAATVLSDAGARPGWLRQVRRLLLEENARRVYRLQS
jgi:hypothetical protein